MVRTIHFCISDFKKVSQRMKNKNYVFLIIVALYFVTMCFLVWVFPKKEYSLSERRKLAQIPEVSVDSILDGNFMTEFEKASLDQFPFRDAFRNLKTVISTQKDEQGMYVADGSIVAMEYPLNQASVQYASKRFHYLYETYLKDSRCKMYLSIIPDKNYFYAEENGYLSYDYTEMISFFQSENAYMTYVDIFEELSKDSYYKTDPHWKQEKIIPVAEKLLETMGCYEKYTYEVVECDSQFYGAYASRTAKKTEADTIKCVINDAINEFRVYDYEHNMEIPLYDFNKLSGNDAYEVYAGGPVSLVTIENKLAETDKELIIFRDSFGSSIAPLMALGYGKVTLVDIRYIQPLILGNYIEFEGQDVLFLYSSLVLNHSETLK